MRGRAALALRDPHGKIAILVCHDIEFPELARQVSEAGADILFVPSCTDDRQGFLRVLCCCHARAIENQVYVAMTSTVGNLRVSGPRMHHGQPAILSPSDLPFARDGIAAEGVPNAEQIVVADADLAGLWKGRAMLAGHLAILGVSVAGLAWAAVEWLGLGWPVARSWH